MTGLEKKENDFSEYDSGFAEYMIRTRNIVDDANQTIYKTLLLLARTLGERNVCLELKNTHGMPETGAWKKILLEHKALCSEAGKNTFPTTPLVIDPADRLYMQKFFLYERDAARLLLERATLSDTSCFNDNAIINMRPGARPSIGEDGIDGQKCAVFNTAAHNLSIITGGPGTGKTTVIAACLALELIRDPEARIVMTALTGKAKSRMAESVRSESQFLNIPEDIKKRLAEIESFTLHTLLRANPLTGECSRNATDPLEYDIVVLDECSMVHLSLFAKMLRALKKETKLILLGDRAQLSSVEAGAVLGGICAAAAGNAVEPALAEECIRLCAERPPLAEHDTLHPLASCVSTLTCVHRFSGGNAIGRISASIRNMRGVDDVEKACAIADEIISCKADEFQVVRGSREFLPAFITDAFSVRNASGYNMFDLARLASRPATLDEAFALLNFSIILSPLRSGPFGTVNLNLLARKILSSEGKYCAGLPVVVLENTPSLGLYNGDIGLFVPDGKGGFAVRFPENPVAYNPASLPAFEPVFAMTVHKSQGSGFDNVCIVMPDIDSPVLTRELVYTGITRARKHVKMLVPSRAVLSASIARKTLRASGLADRLRGF